MSGSIIKKGSLVTPGGVTGSVGPAGRDTQEIGSIKAWPSQTIPPSWDLADGGELLRAMYPELFALVGTSFGAGNGTTTFNKPDLRGRFILGAGTGTGLTSRVLAAKGGEEGHVLSVAEMPAHNHIDSGHVHYCRGVDHLHYCSGVDHLHSMQGHVHGMDHYHNIDFGQVNHAHTIWGYTNSNATSAGGGGYSVANSSGPTSTAGFGVGSSTWASQVNGAWVNTGGPSAGTTAASDRSLAFWSAAADRSLAFNSDSAASVIQNTGGSSVHNTMPPYLVLIYIIKLSNTGGATAQAPIADTTQDGLLRRVSGKAGDFVDGTNNCQDLNSFIQSVLPAPVIPPLADATQNGFLKQVSGLSTDYVDGTNNCKDFATAVRNVSTTVRSFNAIGNPNFEVDQRTSGTGIAGGQAWPLDRWLQYRGGGSVVINGSAIQTNGIITIPNTNFPITSQFCRITLTAQEVSLAAGSQFGLIHYVEGSRLRELISGVHSISLLVRCSSPLKFGVALRDNGSTYSLSKLATISTANVWTTIPLPNLPIWTPNATFSTAPGANGYNFIISLAAYYLPASNDIWQTPSAIGAIGQDNFGALPLNTTFDVAFVQHEPGSICSGFIDLSFDRNLDDCLRYFQKTWYYIHKPGTATAQGYRATWNAAASTTIFSSVSFMKPVAKTNPTLTIWNPNSANNSNAYSYNGGTAGTAVTSIAGLSDCGYGGFVSAGAPAAGSYAQWHHTVDTGW